MLQFTSSLRGYGLGIALGGLASAATAAPLDVLDPTPRPIRVSFEMSANPGVVGVAYTAAFPAFYSVSGNVGSVSVSGPDYEAYLTSVGGIIGLPVVAGTFSSFVLSIDLTTLHATAASPQGQLVAPAGPYALLSRVFSSSAPAGYVLFPLPNGTYYFCTANGPLGTCTFVSGAAYDPLSGKLNAPGADTLVHPDILPGSPKAYALGGDLRLNEVPAVPGASPAALGVALLLAAWLALTGRSAARRCREQGA